MNALEAMYGPFDYKEIAFFIQCLDNGSGNIINNFQRQLVFNLFYKYFGDVVTISAINKTDYVKLMIISKKILEAYNMVILPYIFSSKVVRIPNKKSINKKELMKITASPLWEQVKKKYNDPKIEEDILGQIGIILSSEFKIIDFYDDDLHGKIIDPISDIVSEEYLMYVLMI